MFNNIELRNLHPKETIVGLQGVEMKFLRTNIKMTRRDNIKNDEQSNRLDVRKH